jgi:hypothetical protein
MQWIGLPRDGEQGKAVMNALMSRRFPLAAGLVACPDGLSSKQLLC